MKSKKKNSFVKMVQPFFIRMRNINVLVYDADVSIRNGYLLNIF